VTPVEIKILSTHAVVEVLNELVPAFERTSGVRLAFEFNPSAAIKRAIAAGTAFDVAIITRPVIDEMAAQGKIIRDSCVDFARCGLGLAVRKGAPKPDIGTADALKRALLAAKSVARSRDGASGQNFDAMLDRLGIADAMRDKIVIGPGGRIAELVARGEAELAVQQVPELMPVAGADLVGPFPAELQVYTTFAAGVAAASQQREAAQSFIAAFAAPAAAAVFKAHGLEPVAR
jgi:molybdate transport system substrate-binding protein